MRQVNVIGIGAGDPEHLTLQAIRAMNECDVFLHMDKGQEKGQLAQLRLDLVEAHMTGDYRWLEVRDPERDRTGPAYTAAVEDWHEARAELYAGLLREELGEGGVAGILVWGDPALYDSTIRVLERMRDRVAFDYRVIPGITAPQTLAAQHRIPWNRIGGAVQVTTGRRLRTGMPTEADDVLVMLDAECSFTDLPEDTQIFWGAYLGTPDEILLSGTVGDIGEQIVRVRERARANKGWIMDTYLLRRP